VAGLNTAREQSPFDKADWYRKDGQKQNFLTDAAQISHICFS